MMNTLIWSSINSLDSEILTELVQYILSRLDFSSSTATNEDIGYLADCLYAFVSYIISRSQLIKSKKQDGRYFYGYK